MEQIWQHDGTIKQDKSSFSWHNRVGAKADGRKHSLEGPEEREDQLQENKEDM
jgi:hypothetical protein